MYLKKEKKKKGAVGIWKYVELSAAVSLKFFKYLKDFLKINV